VSGEREREEGGREKDGREKSDGEYLFRFYKNKIFGSSKSPKTKN